MKRWPHTGDCVTPTADGTSQPAAEDSSLRWQRERADRTCERERRRKVQYGHVVEHCDRAVARVHQHVARLRAARWSECQHCVRERERVSQVGAGTNRHTLRVCIVEGVV